MAMSIKVCKRFVTVTTLKYFNVEGLLKVIPVIILMMILTLLSHN